jgi:CheY-like chemotaxis protein
LICRTLKSREETRRIPVVMLSAHPDAARSVAEVGADAFIAKPFDVAVLMRTIADLLAARTDV